MKTKVKSVNIIAALDFNNLIGDDDRLPWDLPDDLQYFKKVTNGHTVVMGRKTFESIGSKPLPNRQNIVLTHNDNLNDPRVLVCKTLRCAISRSFSDQIFIIGGRGVFEDALPLVDKLYLTFVYGEFQGNVYFPSIDLSKWEIVRTEQRKADEYHSVPFCFKVFKRKI